MLRISLAVFGLSLLLPAFLPGAEAAASTAGIIITEVKLGGGDDVEFADGSSAKDFVTLYNQSSDPILLDGWSLQYAKAGADFADCASQFAAGNITSLSGVLPAGAASEPIKRSLTDKVDGAVRLIDSGGMVHDLVGWGVTTECYEFTAAPTPANGHSLQRYLDCHGGLPVDTDNNAQDFAEVETPVPGMLSGSVTPACFVPPEDQSEVESPDDTTELGSSCAGVVISELLPNPAGNDSGHEFIELYNPINKEIVLDGCKLQTTANSKTYTFTDETLGKGQHKAFYNDVTGIILSNSGGGSVFLIDADNTEVDQADYAAGLDDDVSWSLVDGVWRQTFLSTPDKANELLALKPCPTGQVRNPMTNRCMNTVTAAAGLAPCASGKQRNPETHRCRSVTSLASVLKACLASQVRNPATNRCKKVETSTLTPCKPGQQRNPATNRCRKNPTGSGTADNINNVKDVLSATTSADKSGWLLAGVSVLGAMLYSLWEWRQEILQQLGILRSKFSL